MNKYRIAKLKFIFTIFCFGTIGVVSKFIPLSSSAIVFYRALLASSFLIAVSFIIKRKFDLYNIKKNLIFILLAGAFMGFNWVFQFESFKIASVSVGTVCYNTMPIFVILLSPIMFKEKLTRKSVVCVLIAMIGIILVSNVLASGINSNQILGCIYGLLGAIFYALVVMITKKMSQINSYDKIIVEFITAMLIMIPYVILDKNASFVFQAGISSNQLVVGVIMLLLLGLFHTGLCYVIYFNSVDILKPSDIAIYTYIDPVVALILSYIVLHENMNAWQIMGAILILISTLVANKS